VKEINYPGGKMKTPAPHGKINFPARKKISNKNGTKGRNLKKLKKNPEFQKKSFAENKDNHNKSRAHFPKEVKEINYPGGKMKTPTPHGKINFTVRKKISNTNGTKGKNSKKVETNPEFLKNPFAENRYNGKKIQSSLSEGSDGEQLSGRKNEIFGCRRKNENFRAEKHTQQKRYQGQKSEKIEKKFGIFKNFLRRE